MFEYRGKDHPHELSSYQRAIVDWVIDGEGHAMVHAVAGSGKTSTLEAISKYLTDQALFCAFSREIRNTLAKRLTELSVKTIHSIGFGTLSYAARREGDGNIDVEEDKYSEIVSRLLAHVLEAGRINPEEPAFSDEFLDYLDLESPKIELRALADHARLSLWRSFDAPLVSVTSKDYDLDIPVLHAASMGRLVQAILHAGYNTLLETIDFTDMVWGPWRLNKRPYQIPVVLIDEAQDLNAAQLELVLRTVRSDGRLMFVGDKNQAIFGFAGAMADSVDRIVARTKAKEFPLSVCYRCPTSHLDLARALVPHIEAAPWAVPGTVEHVSKFRSSAKMKPGDLVLCRNNAPLVEHCLRLIRTGGRACILGTGSKMIQGKVKRIASREGFSFEVMPAYIKGWKEAERRRILNRNNYDLDDSRLARLTDMSETLLALHRYGSCHSVEEFLGMISDLFSNKFGAVLFSTVHRAKGLEADNVFILEPKLLESKAKKGWQRQQDLNLKYVALTRAKANLYFVG